MPTLFCDLSDVLIEVSFDRVVQRWREANGGFLGIKNALQLRDAAFRAFEIGALNERDYCRHLRALTGWSGDDDELVSIWNQAHGAVSLEVIDVLASMRERGWRLVAVTNSNPWHLRHLHGQLGWALAVFDSEVTSLGAQARKPEPRFFNTAVRSVPRNGPQIFVDDRPENVAGARRAGLDGHVFSDVQSMRAACRAVAVAAS